jgi:hypothetical protein
MGPRYGRYILEGAKEERVASWWLCVTWLREREESNVLPQYKEYAGEC